MPMITCKYNEFILAYGNPAVAEWFMGIRTERT
ncbi:hypothetical protein PGTDC60_0659 [Porphyromonas gingivalis TDC60]|uniref:Uncharacterized protein n=1 Tax=Porphyromonas gingivalis (strain ATCC 33277 / DSM 20709 / CIP 103683 / JCM 12257 / NCTC 11834 / 2561) TaxID=431947 RepID=B2RHZ8_PORG3|nr:hypothetical protein PGN_0474 [Porphyromonas gingivalis ATCC 33277]BAK24827.1 hypothetical protein PGTDC60_0659 [Porphyromonas gingivalis TDC60]